MISIDLGTSETRAFTCNGKESDIAIVQSPTGKRHFSTVISFDDNKIRFAELASTYNPDKYVRDIKMAILLCGMDKEEREKYISNHLIFDKYAENGNLIMENQEFHPATLLAFIFQTLCEYANLNESSKTIYFTIPHSWREKTECLKIIDLAGKIIDKDIYFVENDFAVYYDLIYRFPNFINGNLSIILFDFGDSQSSVSIFDFNKSSLAPIKQESIDICGDLFTQKTMDWVISSFEQDFEQQIENNKDNPQLQEAYKETLNILRDTIKGTKNARNKNAIRFREEVIKLKEGLSISKECLFYAISVNSPIPFKKSFKQASYIDYFNEHVNEIKEFEKFVQKELIPENSDQQTLVFVQGKAGFSLFIDRAIHTVFMEFIKDHKTNFKDIDFDDNSIKINDITLTVPSHLLSADDSFSEGACYLYTKTLESNEQQASESSIPNENPFRCESTDENLLAALKEKHNNLTNNNEDQLEIDDLVNDITKFALEIKIALGRSLYTDITSSNKKNLQNLINEAMEKAQDNEFKTTRQAKEYLEEIKSKHKEYTQLEKPPRPKAFVRRAPHSNPSYKKPEQHILEPQNQSKDDSSISSTHSSFNEKMSAPHSNSSSFNDKKTLKSNHPSESEKLNSSTNQSSSTDKEFVQSLNAPVSHQSILARTTSTQPQTKTLKQLVRKTPNSTSSQTSLNPLPSDD